MRAGLLKTVTVAALLSSGSAALGQELVTNGGFEAPVVTAPWVQRVRNEVFGGWRVDDIGQGIVQVGTFGNPLAAEGSQCLELNFFDACGVTQQLATVPGERYIISFSMAGQLNAGPDIKTMLVQWNGTLIDHAQWSRSASGGQWERHTYSVTATISNTTIHFFGENNVDGGPYLDAVSVRHLCHGDFNEDGVVDFFDYLDFVNALSTQDPRADFNQDSAIDFFDYLDFLQEFNAPC